MPAKRHRVTCGDDFRHIVRKGNRVGGAFCIVHAVLHFDEDRPARFGVIASKSVGNAVTRNLVRRRLNTVVDRRLSAGFSGADVVFRVLPRAAQAGFGELASEADSALDRVAKMAREARR